MKIIKINPDENGARPPIHDWRKDTPPEGYAFCPDEFFAVFYSTNPAGFVNIEVADDVVVAMTVNWEAYDAYVAANPIPDPEPVPNPETEPAIWDELDAAYREGVDSV